MSDRALPGVQGGIVWALVLFENEAPFQAADAAGSGGSFPDIRSLGRAVRRRKLQPEFTVQVAAKVRPVLLLQDRPQGRLPEFAALKLTRLTKLDPADLAAIKAQQVKRFFFIPAPGRYGLRGEFAVDLLALTRVHRRSGQRPTARHGHGGGRRAAAGAGTGCWRSPTPACRRSATGDRRPAVGRRAAPDRASGARGAFSGGDAASRPSDGRDGARTTAHG